MSNDRKPDKTVTTERHLQKFTGMALGVSSLYLLVSFLFDMEAAKQIRFTLAIDQSTEVVSMTRWVRQPFNALSIALLLVIGFYHGAKGFQVIFEDYIGEGFWRSFWIVTVKVAAFLLASAGLIALLKITLRV